LAFMLLPSVARAAEPMTIVQGTARPFVNGLDGIGVGLIADVSVEHYFRQPLRVSASLAPAAFAVGRAGTGGIAHGRIGAAYATEYLVLGVAVGGRWAQLGQARPSLAGTLRLGSLDGLRLDLLYGYTFMRNDTTGAPTLAMSHMMGKLSVPIVNRVQLFTEGGFSYEHWLFTTIGVRHTVSVQPGALERPKWIVQAGFGFAWLSDRFPCHYGVEAVPCSETGVWAAGPTLVFGLERRFF
jgi:hypothetical protein